MLVLGFTVVLILLGQSLTEACGVKPLSARVINGDNAQPHAWPWQISLRFRGSHVCGGSLIKPDWVVTAAHCFAADLRPSSYSVVVGAHTLSGQTAVEQTFKLRRLFMHKDFSLSTFQNDIALIRLSSPVKLSSKVNTVCLPTGTAKVGAKCYITGWGQNRNGGNLTDILQQAVLPVASHSDCSRVNDPLLTVDQQSMICAGGQGKSGCEGDSGGPFVCKEGGRWVLRGAVSWAHFECRTDHYSVFARISNFVGWINTKIAETEAGVVPVCADAAPDLCQSRPEDLPKFCNFIYVQIQCSKSCGVC